jgi:branched-chain amino acid aminotransferase
MSPSAVSSTPREDVQQSSELCAAAVAQKIAQAAPATENKLAPLDASKLIFTPTTTPQVVPEANDPVACMTSQCTDHMITVTWTSAAGWAAPELKAYGPFSIMPTASVLHYATECFEGMKAYRGFDGKLRLFRPDCNARRMLTSATRIALPAFEPTELEKLVIALMEVDGARWLPKSRPGSFLYLRPTMIGTSPRLGPQMPGEAMLYIVASFMQNMDDSVSGMKLLASQDDMVRAWPGGFGYAKVGANYGPSLIAQGEARARGYDQILWLFGEENLVTEAGASNFCVVWRTREGKLQLVTASLEDKIILDGVTRRSLLQLARERLADGKSGLEAIEIVERKYSMKEVSEAVEEGRMVEAFACGTAVSISTPVVRTHTDNVLVLRRSSFRDQLPWRDPEDPNGPWQQRRVRCPAQGLVEGHHVRQGGARVGSCHQREGGLSAVPFLHLTHGVWSLKEKRNRHLTVQRCFCIYAKPLECTHNFDILDPLLPFIVL